MHERTIHSYCIILEVVTLLKADAVLILTQIYFLVYRPTYSYLL